MKKVTAAPSPYQTGGNWLLHQSHEIKPQCEIGLLLAGRLASSVSSKNIGRSFTRVNLALCTDLISFCFCFIFISVFASQTDYTAPLYPCVCDMNVFCAALSTLCCLLFQELSIARVFDCHLCFISSLQMDISFCGILFTHFFVHNKQCTRTLSFRVKCKALSMNVLGINKSVTMTCMPIVTPLLTLSCEPHLIFMKITEQNHFLY